MARVLLRYFCVVSAFQRYILSRIQKELPPLGTKQKAQGAQAYMKDIAPFLGVMTPDRRALSRIIFKGAPIPTSDQLGKTARALWRLPHREYQYVANDMIAFFIDYADKNFLKDHVQFLITHKSWWDTVDGLGSAAISPLTRRFRARGLMESWNRNENMWLIRAAIQHQRGRGDEMDVKLLLKFCDAHSNDSRFFIAKAIGWALRDVAKFNRPAVTTFLRLHPHLSAVAVREAIRHA